jgi:hypothetical protein
MSAEAITHPADAVIRRRPCTGEMSAMMTHGAMTLQRIPVGALAFGLLSRERWLALFHKGGHALLLVVGGEAQTEHFSLVSDC